MGKTIVAALLSAVLVCLAACTPSPSSQGAAVEGPAEEGEALELEAEEPGTVREWTDPAPETALAMPTSDELAELERVLEHFWTISGAEWRHEWSEALDLANMILVGFGAPGYYPYFGPMEPIYTEENLDPRRRFVREEPFADSATQEVGYFYRIPADNLDWIIERIFHTAPDHSIDTDYLYYADGYYYRAAGDAGFIGHTPKIRYCEPLPDGGYHIAVDYFSVSEPGELSGTHYMVADLEEIDGKREWTFYYLSSQSMNFSTGKLFYELQPGTLWTVTGTVREGGNFGTGHYLELERPLEVYMQRDRSTISAVGVRPYASEHYTADFSHRVGEVLEVQGTVALRGGRVILESSYPLVSW